MNRLITSTDSDERVEDRGAGEHVGELREILPGLRDEALAEMMEADARTPAGRAMRAARAGKRIAGARRKANSASTAARWRSNVPASRL